MKSNEPFRYHETEIDQTFTEDSKFSDNRTAPTVDSINSLNGHIPDMSSPELVDPVALAKSPFFDDSEPIIDANNGQYLNYKTGTNYRQGGKQLKFESNKTYYHDPDRYFKPMISAPVVYNLEF